MEAVYLAALVIVLRAKGLQVEEGPPLPVYFKDQIIGHFCPDLVVNGVVVVEAKAVRAIDGVHRAQVIDYLKASNIEVGLLLNFGDSPQFQRFKFDNARKVAGNRQRSSTRHHRRPVRAGLRKIGGDPW